MPYPHENPKAKHDFVISSEDELSNKSPQEVFSVLESPVDPAKISKLCSVYSYPDGPANPISRNMIVIGLVEESSSFVQTLSQQNDCMHKCTIAVKQLNPSFPDKDKMNSAAFAKFITKLRRGELVAILGADKFGRFGIFKPMAEEGGVEEKLAADCFVGDISKAKEFMGPCVTINGSVDAGGSSSDGLWQPPGGGGDGGTEAGGLWQPPGAEDDGGGIWQPPDENGDDSGLWQPPGGGDVGGTFGATTDSAPVVDAPFSPNKRTTDETEDKTFHKDAGAATADRFYSGLTRTLDTRAESKLFHMRAFNGWVKATQIQELNPQTMQKGKRKKGSTPLRVLDLACGKGGDLTKWTLHVRGMSNYVGVDVARGSLRDAAERARGFRNKLERCTFTCADLGADVPGRLKSAKSKLMQKLLSWSLNDESEFEKGTPVFKDVQGGGISLSDKFDVISIQFAIHYMMSSRKRARRFFRTVSELLEIGGNLIATTIDARILISHLMNLGEDLHFDSDEDQLDNEIIVEVGAGACRFRFKRDTVKKIFHAQAQESTSFSDDVFGLEYTFTLVEGSDHAAGVGEAVDLPEWLTPIPVLKSLAEEVGLELEYHLNFHEFFELRKDSQTFPAAHLALYNMKVLNRNGSISPDEWEISRLYCAVKFKKVREAPQVFEDSDDDNADEGEEEPEQQEELPPTTSDQKFLVKAMMMAKNSVGREAWDSLDGDEKKRLTQLELAKLSGK